MGTRGIREAAWAKIKVLDPSDPTKGSFWKMILMWSTHIVSGICVDPEYEPRAFPTGNCEKLKLRTECWYIQNLAGQADKRDQNWHHKDPPSPATAWSRGLFLLLFGAKVSKFERRDPTNRAAQPLEDCDRHPSEASSKSTVLGPQIWDVKIKYSNLPFLRSQSSMWHVSSSVAVM